MMQSRFQEFLDFSALANGFDGIGYTARLGLNLLKQIRPTNNLSLNPVETHQAMAGNSPSIQKTSVSILVNSG